MKRRIIGIISVLVFAIMLAACGSTPQVETPKTEEPATVAEETTMESIPLPQLSYDKGLEAIDIMFEYAANHSGDTAMEKLQAIQEEINDDKDFVSSYINIFLVDINFEKSKDDIIEDIKLFQDELDRRIPK